MIGAYHRGCSEQITKAGGYVANTWASQVLADFGHPQAHADDAERGVRAALSLTDAIPKLPTEHGAALQVRIGIATGLVVVGDLIGEGDAQERGVVGDTPNLAARLQAFAEPLPGQLVISNSTHGLRCWGLQHLGRRSEDRWRVGGELLQTPDQRTTHWVGSWNWAKAAARTPSSRRYCATMGIFSKSARLVSCAITATASIPVSAQQGQKPNIVLIVSDDFGYGDAGIRRRRNRGTPTPNLDRLAAEGIVASLSSTPQPSCTPGRAAMNTGCIPDGSGITTVAFQGQGGGRRLPSGRWLRSSRPAGIRTFFTGKWHSARPTTRFPTRRAMTK